MNPSPSTGLLLIKECTLSYNIGENILIAIYIYTHYGNLT